MNFFSQNCRYSTGKVGYIQTTRKTADIISTVDDNFPDRPEFEWEQLDPTFVKGKGMMEVCRLKQDDVETEETTRPVKYDPLTM